MTEDILRSINYLIYRHRLIAKLDKAIDHEDLKQEAIEIYLKIKKSWQDRGNCSLKTYVINEINQHFMRMFKTRLPLNKQLHTDKLVEPHYTPNITSYLDLPKLKQVLVKELLDGDGVAVKVTNKGIKSRVLEYHLREHHGATKITATKTVQEIVRFL